MVHFQIVILHALRHQAGHVSGQLHPRSFHNVGPTVLECVLPDCLICEVDLCCLLGERRQTLPVLRGDGNSERSHLCPQHMQHAPARPHLSTPTECAVYVQECISKVVHRANQGTFALKMHWLEKV